MINNPHLDAALTWFDAGCAVIPAVANGQKRPAVEWKKFYSETPPTRGQVIDWFTEHPEWGVGLICGAMSNGLELTEIESCRMGGDHHDKVMDQMVEYGVEDLWESLLTSGYCESTPSGGIHVLYRVEGVDIPGNHKLATDATGTVTYAETRGTGGFVIVAPTSGTVHPTGESWTVLAGKVGDIPVISWDERCAIHDALTAALNERVRETREYSAPAPRATPNGAPASLRPGDDFNARGDSWYDLLVRNGWSFCRRDGDQELFTRPGKNPRDGHSAATNYRGQPGLYVWSGMPQERAYDKFGALVELEFNGDFKAAVKYLAAQGYGDQGEFEPVTDMSDWATIEKPEPMTVQLANGQDVSFEPRDTQRQSRPYVKEYNHVGVAEFAQETIGDRFRRVSEERAWRFYEDGRWVEDDNDNLSLHLGKVTKYIKAAKDKDLEDARAGGDKEEIASAKALATFANSLRMNKGVKDLMETFGRQKGISVSAKAFDASTDLLVLDNGTFDLSTMSLRDHNPADMITKRVGVSYDPDAVAPRWNKYLSEALPDPEQRRYIQRAIGMTILARMDDAAFFVLHGLTGCGKSQFVNVMRAVLGEYAEEAPPSTFQASKFGGGSGPGDDLHTLRGVRFASVSETEEGEVLKEALLKRVTGDDPVKSRALYQGFVSWKPQFTVWMMTNHKPKLSSTDGAIWRRVKPIHFPSNFSESPTRELGLSKKIIATELSGVFNWVLEGVREYLRIGLAEPAETTAAIAEYRAEVDPVQTFLTEAADEGRIIVDPDAKIKSQDLFNEYCDWCRDNNVRFPLATRRFGQRLSELGFGTDKGTNGIRMRIGIKVNDSFRSSLGWLAR